MKLRRLLILTVALSLVGGSAIYADTVVQKVRIVINKQELDDQGMLEEGKAYVGVRSLADLMKALVIWDDSAKKVSIVKPNVHMFLMDGSKPFGGVERGKKSFKVFSQVDNLTVSINAFKVTIADPYGDEKEIETHTSKENDFPTDKDNFWFTSGEFTYNFSSVGKYTIRFWMRSADGGSYQVVSEKTVFAK
ncbi:copper amine oxidase [Cohnella hashimotonis]|uniref:Copper amine oxidase n=1 Tax=Cohnella hashimotonis TaxID=2826895 RepID=A0ABT6TID6_9BACL|nr:copper amine oxidase [Cohnella hashimotonis]MDI4646490.1 copper amine oxidase [Cohnella hashimotonis]